MSLRILVDENIPLAEELFGSLGDVVLAPGRDVDETFPGLETFDLLAIRSVTRVTSALVERAAKCRMIGTATIGTDHVNMSYIEQANGRRKNPITVVGAPGSNADSVADYVWYALAHITGGRRGSLSDRSLGIIGNGNCGSRVGRRAEGFGMKVFRHDPPLAERDAGFASDSFEATIAADFVTVHVPLTRAGVSAYPTYHMIGAEELARMRPGAYLLNTSRGAVVDSAALVAALSGAVIAGAVLDVYEGEPEPLEELIRLPVLATPHIAGYAVEAKRRGAVVIYEAACRAFGVTPQNTRPLLAGGFEPPAGAAVHFPAGREVQASADDAVRRLLGAVYDIDATSRGLKGTLGTPERAALFDRMRKDYESDCNRRELAMYRVGFAQSVGAPLRAAIERRLAGFGIEVTGARPHYVLDCRGRPAAGAEGRAIR